MVRPVEQTRFRVWPWLRGGEIGVLSVYTAIFKKPTRFVIQ